MSPPEACQADRQLLVLPTSSIVEAVGTDVPDDCDLASIAANFDATADEWECR
jgi:hypothetical protein